MAADGVDDEDVACAVAPGGGDDRHSGAAAGSPLPVCCEKDANVVPSPEPPDLFLRLYGPRFMPFFLSFRMPSWH